MGKSIENGWKSKKYKTSIIVGSEQNPTNFESGQVIINQKATEKNLAKLIKINKDGLEGKFEPKVTNDATDGGLLIGKHHYDKKGKPLGGIPGKVDGEKLIETETAEFVLNKEASEKHWKELSKINTSTGGVPINPPSKYDDDPEYDFKKGGNVIEFNPNHLPQKAIMNFANEVRVKYPKVWDLGGNIFGNQAFKNLTSVRKRGYWLDSEEWMYIKWRAYVARHIHDFRIAGVIAMLKWGDKVEKGFPYMKDLIEKEIKKRYKKELNKSGGSLKIKHGSPLTWKQKFNQEYGFDKNQSHSLEEIAEITGISTIGIQAIYNKGIGAYKTNPQSVRPNVKSKEQWAMARVYSAVMGGRAAKVDSNELKMNIGGNLENNPESNERFIVKPKIKFGMLFGYVVYDTLEKKNTAYEYDEDELYKAKSRAELMSSFKKMEIGGLISSQPPTENQLWNNLVHNYKKGGYTELKNNEMKNKMEDNSTDEISAIKSEINKLYIKSFKMMPNSPRQKEVIKQIDELRKKLERMNGKYADGGSTDAKDTATIDIPLLIRLLELSREDIDSDAELHQVVERLLDLKNKPILTMDDYAYIADIEQKHVNQMALGGTLDSDPQKLISQAHYNITVKKGRKEYAPTSHEIQEEIDRMVMEGQFGSNNI